MIGIIGAMPVEIEGLRSIMDNRRDKVFSGVTFSSGTISGAEVTLAVSGVGKVMASMCATAMCVCFSPSLVINTGVAGSLSPELSVGDILVAEALAQHDFDTGAIDGTPRGWIGAFNGVLLPADGTAAQILCGAAAGCGIKASKGIIVSGDQFIADAAVKDDLRRTFGASACEMEGAAIAAVSAVNSIPFAVLRAVSDSADGGAAENFPAFCRRSAENSIKVLTRALPSLNDIFSA